MLQSLSTELALKAFEADAALSAALAEFQAQPAAGTIIEEAQRAAAFGFSWFARPSELGFVEVRLRHKAGAEISAEGESITALLAGLLGHPLAQDIAVLAADQAAEPEQGKSAAKPGGWREQIALIKPVTITAVCDSPGANGLSYTCDPAGDTGPHIGLDATPQAADPEQGESSLSPAQGYAAFCTSRDQACQVGRALLAPSPAQVAAESLAAATGGVVVTEPSEYVPDPDEAEQARLAGPLTAEQKAACIGGINLLPSDKMRAFKISFRDAFKVPREAKSIAPLITEVRHMEFCDRWSIEAGGGVAA